MWFNIIKYIAKTKRKYTQRVHTYTMRCTLDYCLSTFRVHAFTSLLIRGCVNWKFSVIDWIFLALTKNLKAVRHFNRLHWGWSIVIYNCNSHPCSSVSAERRIISLQTKNKTVTSLLQCVWLRIVEYTLVKRKRWSVHVRCRFIWSEVSTAIYHTTLKSAKTVFIAWIS